MIQADEEMFDLEDIQLEDPVDVSQVNETQERDFEIVWVGAAPWYHLTEDTKSVAHERVSVALDILKEIFPIKFEKLRFLDKAQYNTLKSVMELMESLLSKVHLTDTFKGDVVFALDQQRYSKLMSTLRKMRGKAQSSLEAIGIPNLPLPVWGAYNDITKWVTYSELEVFGVRFRLETEIFLAQLMQYHDWETGQPKDQCDEAEDILRQLTKRETSVW